MTLVFEIKTGSGAIGSRSCQVIDLAANSENTVAWTRGGAMKRTLLVLILAALSVLSACGGGASGPQPISVVMSQPPASLAINKTATIAATVSHDAANAGVTWSCAPAGSCGSLSATSTASGANTTYTAPPAIPAGNSVTITATSVTDTSKTASATVTILPPFSNVTLKGKYAFLLNASTFNAGIKWLAGSVTLDGTGNITAGIQDYVASPSSDIADAISSGTYVIDANGHGTMTYTTANAKTVKFSLAVTSTSHALVAEVDGHPASGTFDLQSAGPTFTMAQFSGPYSFTLSGTDQNLLHMVAAGGDFVAGGTTGLLNTGTYDLNIDGVATSSFLAGGFAAPDSNGRGALTLSSGPGMAYYIVTPSVVRMVQVDGAQIFGGSAYAQGSTANISDGSLAGNFVFQQAGHGTSGQSAVAGQVTSNGAGTITSGLADLNASGVVNTAQAVSGTYAFTNPPVGTLILSGANFTGNVYIVDPKVNILDPNNASGGGGFLLLNTGASIVGTGVLIPQKASGAFAAGEALGLSNPVPGSNPANEVDLIGLFSSNAGNLAGTVDYDQATVNQNPMLGASATATVTADAAHPGRSVATVSITTPGQGYGFALGTPFAVSIYKASDTQAVILETDTLGGGSGVMVQQAP
jgi:hypothetical protein